jgi:glycosyltransferase involved in cell wall biosynthesis
MSATLISSGASAVVDAGRSIEVTVVMPCLNEARTLGRCVDKAIHSLGEMHVAGEVVVADNGSTDGSPEIARAHGARVIHVEKKGYGSALAAGISSARGRFVIMGDADDSYDFSNLTPFVERLRAGDELVMGNRFRGGIRRGAMPWHHRYIGNPVLTGILNLFFRSPIGDAHCGLRGFQKASYERLGLTTTGMEFASEMVVRACLLKQRISEVPTVLHPDGRDRPPHLRSFRDGWRHLRFLLLLCPTWLYLIPSLCLMATGFGLMAWLTPGPQPLGSVVLDVHTVLLGSLLAIMGYQTLWLWAFARIYGWTSGLLPLETFKTRAFKILNLERGLLAGLLMLVIGLGLNIALVAQWYHRHLGALEVQITLRYALWGLTTMIMGVQTIYGSFFLSLLGMGNRIADKLPARGEPS